MSDQLHEEESLRSALIYDGDCTFCAYWVERWRSRVGDDVEFVPYQLRGDRFPEIATEELQRAVHYVDPYGAAFRGAEGVFRLLRHARGRGWLLTVYQGVPGVKPFTEAVYGVVARHRKAAAPITRLLWGKRFAPQERYIGRWLFMRNLGLIFFTAFLSLYVQLPGLIGANGVISAADGAAFLENALGDQRYQRFPSVFWLDVSDEALLGGCVLGMIVSLLLTLGFAPPVMIFAAWVLYLSLLNMAQDFLSFQWDVLLLETAFLAMFFGPFRLVPGLGKESRPSPVIAFLLWWLLFRLIFSSGFVKLDDPTWRSLTALSYHYETQPLPTWPAWYVHHLPAWFHEISCALMFLVELVVPFFIFFPRRIRHTAGIVIIGFQLVIAATGNYTFFNWLTIALCFLLFDDPFWRALVPKGLRGRLATPLPYSRIPIPRKALAAILLVTLLPLSLVVTTFRLFPEFTVPKVAADTYEATAGFHLVNAYGLFAQMTTERPEIDVQGSNDGVVWKPYKFKWKPDELDERPQFVAPYQPRLDWQMWFAALGSDNTTPWFQLLVVRLLEGSPDVLKLLDYNPFPGQPPRYIRAVKYDYRFSTPDERRETGAWWVREEIGEYLQPSGFRRPPF